MFTLIKDNVRVSIHTDCNEGYNGDYNSNDPNDKRLYRFDVDIMEDNMWIPVDDASYCTNLHTDMPAEVINNSMNYIMDKVFAPCSNKSSIKKLCEMLSWINPSWLNM